MAKLTAQAKDGEVSIEIAPDETSASAAKRLVAAVEAAGGLRVPRRSRDQRLRERRHAKAPSAPPAPTPDPRHQLMREMSLLECELCKAWVPATRVAAERHNERCPVERTPN